MPRLATYALVLVLAADRWWQLPAFSPLSLLLGFLATMLVFFAAFNFYDRKQH